MTSILKHEQPRNFVVCEHQVFEKCDRSEDRGIFHKLRSGEMTAGFVATHWPSNVRLSIDNELYTLHDAMSAHNDEDDLRVCSVALDSFWQVLTSELHSPPRPRDTKVLERSRRLRSSQPLTTATSRLRSGSRVSVCRETAGSLRSA
jgi:hypothetical protein